MVIICFFKFIFK
uniref:Uncharacterized protein n=1 Tax=Anguilla anguilla TaxID=7936 RepID=A0A0E9V529_ANGAN